MPHVYYIDQKGKGLKLNYGVNYLQTPYSSLYNFGVTQNFSITWTGILLIPSVSNSIPRYTLVTRRRTGLGASNISYEILVNPPGLNGLSYGSANFIIWDNTTPTANAVLQNVYFNIPEQYFGHVVTITFVKYNANPASSLSQIEWFGYLNHTQPQNFYSNNGLFTPSTVITDSTSTLKFNTNGALSNETVSAMTMYNFAIFNRALTITEAREIGYNQGRIPRSAKPARVVHYDFEQKSGTTILDRSGNGLNASLLGTANTTPGVGNQWVDNEQSSLLAA
jgi:hypothetical protein